MRFLSSPRNLFRHVIHNFVARRIDLCFSSSTLLVLQNLPTSSSKICIDEATLPLYLSLPPLGPDPCQLNHRVCFLLTDC